MYESIAWALFSFIFGAGLGGWLVYRLTGATAGPRIPHMRQGLHEWARRDLLIPEPTAQATNVRLITDYRDDDTRANGRILAFTLFDTRLGMDRDVTFAAPLVLRFLKLDTPARSEWHGANGDYSKLLAIAKHYGWIEEDSGHYGWVGLYGTRERRLDLWRGMRCRQD